MRHAQNAYRKTQGTYRGQILVEYQKGTIWKSYRTLHREPVYKI